MADDFSLPSDDPFASLNPHDFVGVHTTEPDDPFAGLDPNGFGSPGAPSSSALGAATRGAVRGALPAAGGLAAAGAGAGAGFVAGEAAFPLGGGIIGGLVGGIAGGLGGSYAVSTAQDYALSKAPDSWTEALGQDDRQQRLDQEQHPYASFLGGLAPYALTMSPFGAAKAALPSNATALQRLMANPVTARVFGGAMMGGMELGQEAASGQPVDWAKVGIATGFGVVLNRPNRLGETIEGFGARPFRGPAPVAPVVRPPLEERGTEIPQHEDEGGYFAALHDALSLPQASNADVLGVTAPRADENLGLRGFGQVEDSFITGGNQGDLGALAPNLDLDPWQELHDRLTELPNPYSDYDIMGVMAPTIIQSGDVGVMGPGITEDTFLGAHEQEAQAKMAAQDAARAEQGLVGPNLPDVETAARRTEPELFGRYDALTAQRDAFRAQIERASNPPDEDIQASQAAVAAAQARLDAHLETAGGYAGGPEARRLRALVRSAQGEADAITARRQAHEAGAGADTPEVAAMRQQLQQVDFALRDVAPEVSAARRRAAEALRAGTVAPEAIPAPRQSEAPIVGEKVNWDRSTVGNGRPVGDDMTVVDVPVAALDAAFRRDSPDFHVETPKTETTEHAAAGKPMSVPQVGAVDGKIGVDNGRNRIAAAREMGATTIPIAVEKSNVADVMAALGTEPAPPPAPRTIEQQRGFIEDDVRRKLTAAGRPAEEADAAARLTSALYETHAERLGNKAGTPEELYRKDSPGVELSAKLRKAFGKLTPDGIIRLAKDAHAGTFVHELGHDWLNRLVADSQRLEASASLRSDVNAIRDYIGWSRDGAITPRQHEKFASAFERYLHDGVAPSARLASTFAKFRNWLVEVYRSIAGARKPDEISESIRGVFDRMLSTEPQRTVVAPERPGGPSLADIHEVDARDVEPQDAENMAERIMFERERYAEDQPPEIEHELAPKVAEVEAEHAAGAGADAAGEAGRGDRGPPEVERGGGQAGTEPGGERVGAGRGEERAGGDIATAESRSVSGGSRPESTGGPKSQPLAPAPAEFFDPTPDERLVDRAGNIRVENLTNVEDVARAIHASAERNDDFISARGQPQTKGQMLDLAETLGIDPARVSQDSLSRLLGGTKDLGARVLAARKLVVESAGAVSDLMNRVADSDDPQTMADYAQAVARHDMIQSALAGVTAEWGRAGSAFHNLMEGWDKAEDINAFLKQHTGRDLYQLKLMAKLGRNLDSPGKISKFIRDAGKRSGGRMILEYWINGLISGVATHATYVVGNTALMLERIGPETLVAAGLGRLHEGEKVYAGEVGASLGHLARTLPRATQAAIEGFRSGQSTLLPGETARPLLPFSGDALPAAPRIARTTTEIDVAWGEVRADLFGAIRGLRDGVVANGKLLASGGVPDTGLFTARYSPLGQIPDIGIRGATVLPIGTLARIPSRGVAAIHSFFRVMNYSVDNNARAWRQATYEGRTGADHDARVAQLRQDPSPESMEASRGTANEATLMGGGGEFVHRLSRLTNWAPNLPGLGETPVLKFIDPFVHIAANIIDQSFVKRTPVGLLSTELRADLMGKNGNVARDTAAARMLVGSALSITFGGLAAEGYMSGSGPTDPSKAAMWRLAGNQAHSIRVGDVWYDVHRLGALGMLAGVAADMYDVAHVASQGDLLAAGALLQHAVTQNVLDESFMRGPAELIQAVEDPGRYGERYIQNFLSSFVPYSAGQSQVARAVDPYTRQARTVMDSIKQKIPGLSETLFPRRDVWGEPMPNHDALVANGLTAIYESRMSRDPVNQAMVQLGIGVAPVPRSIRNVKLDEGQYDDFARLAGRMTKQRLDVIVRSPDWQNWAPHARRDVVEEVVKQSREAARGVIFMKYPSIPAEATRNKFLKEQD